MATYDLATNFVQAVMDTGTHVMKAENTINFAATNVQSADVIKCLPIPANAIVFNVYAIVRTAEGATCTGTLGDTGGAATWKSSVNLNATAGTVVKGLEATDANATNGKFYSASDFIQLTMANASAAAKITVVAFYGMIER